MEKQDITRESLRDTMMKNIVFRFDYQGMIDSTEFVRETKEYLLASFKSYNKNVHNSIDLSLSNFEDVSRSLSIPVSEINKQDVHVFTENTFGKDKATLFISVYNAILHIECVDYDNLNPYMSFIQHFIDLLFEKNEFLSLKRFGLRKIGSKLFSSLEEVYNDFERRNFSFDSSPLDSFSLVNSRNDELLEDDSSSLRITYSRSLDTGVAINPETLEEYRAYQATLDLDAFLDEAALIKNNYRTTLKEKIVEINGGYLFDLFKRTMTTEFLNQNLKK